MTFAIDQRRWSTAVQLIDGLVAQGTLPAVSVAAGTIQGGESVYATGQFDPHALAGGRSVTTDDPFLVASITKPVTVAAAMVLVERGVISLDDPVAAHVPEFHGPGKNAIRIRHLMSHTSGLPDMLPSNDSLRASHAPFSQFVAEICRCELLFEPGCRVSYQSMGTAMLAEIVQRLDGRPFGQFVREEFFGPLGMNSTNLGVHGEKAHAVVRIRLAAEQLATDWNWNSPYWLGFGAPWGGMTATAANLGRWARLFLNGGKRESIRIFSNTTVKLMTASRMDAFPKLTDDDRRTRTWGLGWRIVGAGVATHLGEVLPPEAYGHYGATGTILWIDPTRDAYAVILTNRAFEQTEPDMLRLSNAISAAIVRS